MEHTFSVIGCDKKTTQELLGVLSDFPSFIHLSVSNHYEEAFENVLKESPSLVFLDVDKKGEVKDPFNFVKELYLYLSPVPSFVAVSNSKRKAYEVIKHDFVDYLLKPINQLEFRKFLTKYDKLYGKEDSAKICLKSYSDYQIIDLNEILYLQADNNTTDFYLSDNRKTTAFKTLKHFQNVLPSNFLRVHHSYIINTNHITRINFAKGIIVVGGKSANIPFSRTYRNEVDHLKDSYYSHLSIVS